MTNEDSVKQPATAEEDLKVPTPPAQVVAEPEQAGSAQNQQVEATPSEETVINNNAETNTDVKVQNHDWNNGKPEVTKDLQPSLDTHEGEAHKTADQKNDEALRENKGNKEGEPVLEASEEVNTGQNSG